MEKENLEQVKELINRIADSYDLPPDEYVEEIERLTNKNWKPEDLQELCCEYWSHHSLDETAYAMFHGEYPPACDIELIFWKYKTGVKLDDEIVYENYRLGRKTLIELEALPLEKILEKITEVFSDWQKKDRPGENNWRFDNVKQTEYWKNIHFCIFEYGRETEIQREHQILRFSCHNMSEKDINTIIECMENFQCSLHIRIN